MNFYIENTSVVNGYTYDITFTCRNTSSTSSTGRTQLTSCRVKVVSRQNVTTPSTYSALCSLFYNAESITVVSGTARYYYSSSSSRSTTLGSSNTITPKSTSSFTITHIHTTSSSSYSSATFSGNYGFSRNSGSKSNMYLPFIVEKVTYKGTSLPYLYIKINGTTYLAYERNITFKISNTTYTAEKRMTWAQWVNSSYNTAGYYISDSLVMENSGRGFYVSYSSLGVSPNDEIVKNRAYDLRSGHSGGGADSIGDDLEEM